MTEAYYHTHALAHTQTLYTQYAHIHTAETHRILMALQCTHAAFPERKNVFTQVAVDVNVVECVC